MTMTDKYIEMEQDARWLSRQDWLEKYGWGEEKVYHDLMNESQSIDDDYRENEDV